MFYLEQSHQNLEGSIFLYQLRRESVSYDNFRHGDNSGDIMEPENKLWIKKFKEGFSMKATKKLTALLLAGVLAAGVALPQAPAEAADIQPLPFTTYVNGSVVTINNSLLYGGHTYVQLRELANVTNMGIDFVQTGESTMQPGGGLPEGISIDQPTFVYVKEDVQDWSGDGLVMLDEAVDITTLFSRYQTRVGDFDYAFDSMAGTFNVPDGKLPIHVVQWQGKTYVSVDDFRDTIQPYLVDMCMQ